MSGPPTQEAGELRLAPESIEALAGRIAEILADATPSKRSGLLSAEEVARWWGIGRRWVYEHADELGARRLGAGPRPRLRFDPEEVAARLGSPGEGGRSEPIGGDCGDDSLSSRDRANVVRQRRRRPGATPLKRAPDPAPDRRHFR
ncbi:MAG: helix-turn-helix domain-containing protein [Actinobacteria bacterium]|nr:helix-turn-helix domain-containing protein [Actinomycetota bacterium]